MNLHPLEPHFREWESFFRRRLRQQTALRIVCPKTGDHQGRRNHPGHPENQFVASRESVGQAERQRTQTTVRIHPVATEAPTTIFRAPMRSK